MPPPIYQSSDTPVDDMGPVHETNFGNTALKTTLSIIMNKHFNIVSECQTYTYFFVESKTSATAPSLALFIAGRYSHAEPPIVKHSTELSDLPFSLSPPITTMVSPVITAQHLFLFSNMDGKSCGLACLAVIHEHIIESFISFITSSKHNNLISPANCCHT